jgi:NAD(P)-dependent dehydrogenase (short-subunit alcohol dehydrogenase family)
MSRLQNKFAIITGAYEGIGRGIAEAFLAQGATVLMADKNPNVIAAAQQLSLKHHGRAVGVVADVGNKQDVLSIFAAADSVGMKIDTLVNNAGRELTKPLLDTEEEEWDDILRVNLKSVYLMSRETIARMKHTGGGNVINMGSVTAIVGFQNYPAYSASKGAIHALTRQMAMELAPLRIRVNTIYPGTIKTPLAIRNFSAGGGDLEAALAASAAAHPVGRLGEPADVAAMAVFLASDEAGFVNGMEMGVDGGFTIAGV